MTSLIGRLHEGESKRHSLHLILDQHKAEVARLSSACQEALGLESQVEQLSKDLAGMVTHERYLSVCGDLEAALKREQELKSSLSRHGKALRQMQTKLQQEGQSAKTKNAALFVLEKVSKNYFCTTLKLDVALSVIHAHHTHTCTHTCTHTHTHTHLYTNRN